MRAFLFIAAALALAGCATTTIEQNVPGHPQPSAKVGFLHWIYSPDHKTHIGAAFTSEGHDTYNYLLGKYGADLKPPRTTDFGVTVSGKEYDLTREAIDDWGLMATWSRSNEHLPKTFWQKVLNGGRGE